MDKGVLMVTLVMEGVMMPVIVAPLELPLWDLNYMVLVSV